MERKKDPRAETKPVGIWIRVSTEDQAQGESPQHHEMRGRSYAESRLWEVREVYRLEGVSGKSVMEHPEARRMMADVRRGRIAGLIFSKLARLARNTKELLDFAEFFRENGADLVSLQESIDTSTPHGRLFYTMIAAMAEWEREEIASRVAASIPVRAKLGKPLGGAAPLGYRWVEKRLEVNPEEAPLRRLIYELFKEHRRLKTVAEILNQAGHRGRNGRPFRDTTVEKLIVDPTAKGLRRASYTRLVKGQRVLKPETEWIWVPCPSIVSEELWEQCNALLLKRRASRKPVAKRAVYAFAGYVYCECGQKMYVRSNTPKYVCKACHMKIPIVDLDNLFRDELREFTFSPEAIAAWLAQGAEVLAGQEELMDALFGERERLTKEADKLYRLYQEDALSVEGFREKHRPLEERLAALGGEIARLQGEIDFLKIRTVMEEDIIAQTRDLAEKWLTMDIPEKRRVVESLLRRITIHKDVVDIDLANLPPLSEMMAKGPPIPAAEWEPRFTSTVYDPRLIPAPEKAGALSGMAMTEKQGGSDVRANTTEARPIGAGGPGGQYELTGHKWFCSAPMCDAFLVLAQAPGGLSCFLLPRFTPDGARNRFHLQRLKDKLGNRSNASSEVEFRAAWARLVGEEGRGVPTILEMVMHTRLDCVIGGTASLRAGTARAIHHARHRRAFGKWLIDQPLMRNVLADLQIESEAATVAMMRLARAYDAEETPFRRLATAVLKYWICKRAPVHAAEALECLGGNGYVEEWGMARLFRESPLNSIWEGSGNVQCLDVLRAVQKSPESLAALFQEIQEARGADHRLDLYMNELRNDLERMEDLEARARRIVERLALALQASLLLRHAPADVADAFCASRLEGDGGRAFGTLPAGTDFGGILERAG